MLAAVMSLVFTAMIWPRKSVTGARALLVLTLAVAWWCLTEGLINLVPGLANKVSILGPQYLGVTSVPPLFTAFVLAYCGRLAALKNPWTITGLTLPPVVVLILAWTNPWHHLIWIKLTLEHFRGASLIGYVHGPAFFVWVAFSYVYLIVGLGFLLWQFFQSQSLYRRQVVLVLIGAVMPWTGNAIYISGLSPLPHLDLTPLSFSFTIAALGVAYIRYQLTDIMPVARAMVFNGIGDAVFVIDNSLRVVDINRAAKELLGVTAQQVLGRPAEEVFAPWADKVEALRGVDRGRTEIVIQREDLWDGEARYFDLTVSPLTDARAIEARKLGRLYVVREVTEQRQAEEILKTSEAMFRNLVESLPFPVLVVSGGGRIGYVNPALEKIFGHSAGDIPDLETWFKLTLPDKRERSGILSREEDWLAGRGGGMEAEQTLTDAWKREHQTLVRRLALGRNYYFIYEDLTERRATEEAMRQRAKLEGVMEMAGAACHEMNQPLQAVYGQCELAMMKLDPEDDIHRRLSNMLTGLDTLAKITAKIQSITRYETLNYDGGSTIIDIHKASRDN